MCETCTESLTQAYTFYERVKSSDLRIQAQLEQARIRESVKEKNGYENIEYIMDSEDHPNESGLELKQSNYNKKTKRIHTADKLDKQAKTAPRKKEKISLCEPYSQQHVIGVNIALPHFIITDSAFEDNSQESKSFENDEDGITEPQKKSIKTLTPTVVIPPDLNEINDFCMSPIEFDGDGHSIFKCSHCLKAYSTPYHLMVHIRKSHICQYCWCEPFSKTTDLYEHVKESHKIFNCLLCRKEFQSNGNLRQHLRKNHGVALPAHISLLSVIQSNKY